MGFQRIGWMGDENREKTVRDKPWIRKSLNEKRTAVISNAHARPTFCLLCETRVMPEDRQTHRARCPGPLQPDPLDRWDSAKQAKAKGLTDGAIKHNIGSGRLRSRETNEGTEYLTRDVEMIVDTLAMVARSEMPPDTSDKILTEVRRAFEQKRVLFSLRDLAKELRLRRALVSEKVAFLIENGEVCRERRFRYVWTGTPRDAKGRQGTPRDANEDEGTTV